MSKRKQMPQSPEEYKVKYVFKEEEINLNEIIKQCFEMQLSNLLTKQQKRLSFWKNLLYNIVKGLLGREVSDEQWFISTK